MNKLHIISGLPRSGSTLLSSILKQNPRFTAGISDPIYDMIKSAISTANTGVGMRIQVPDQKLIDMVRAMFAEFYRDGNEICFNTNRMWTANTALLKQLYPDAKIIACVREVPWILDSFEKLNSKNPLTLKPIYHYQSLNTVYERCSMLMGEYANHPGHLITPILSLKQAVYSEDSNMVCVVDYEKLATDPHSVMKQIYNFIGEPWFDHNFDNVEDSYDEFDNEVKIKGLHTIRRKVEYISRRPEIPEDIWLKYMNLSFWKDEDFQRIKRRINWID